MDIWGDILAHAHHISLVSPDIPGKDFNTSFYSTLFPGSQPVLSWTFKKSSHVLFLVLGTISQRHLLITMLMPKKYFKAFFLNALS